MVQNIVFFVTDTFGKYFSDIEKLLTTARPMKRPAFQMKSERTIIKLNEKMITNKEATTDTIKRAKSDMGRPHINAPLHYY